MNIERTARRDRTDSLGSDSADPANAVFKTRDALAVTAIFTALTIAFTWPLAAGVTRNVPGDLGDPLFSAWVLAWDATHLGRGWLQANIFYPNPLTLLYSELLLPQALLVLPVYAITGNPLLCYNLVFLATFVLSGLGMFLLCRELTGSRTAGFVAGLAYAFAPYRVPSIPHLPVMSSQWLPFVFFGFSRYFVAASCSAEASRYIDDSLGATAKASRYRLPLAGATVAWILQNLSCGYYLFYFSPAIAGYLLWEVTRRHLWRNGRVVRQVTTAWAAMFVATAPFLLAYYQLRRTGMEARTAIELRQYSADVLAYLTADPNLWFWGRLAHAWPRGEGLLFPGLTIVVLAVLGAWPGGDRTLRVQDADDRRPLRRFALWTMSALAAIVVTTLLLGFRIQLPGIKITSLPRALTVIVAAFAIWSWRRPGARHRVRAWLASPAGFFVLLTAFAVVMSFGPVVYARGRVVAEPGLYAAFNAVVPGFDGLRVPARFAMLAAFGLAVLAAFGIAALERTNHRRARWQAAAAGTLILFESLAVPIPINQNIPHYMEPGLAALPGSIDIGAGLPDVYRFVAQLPPNTVIMELPIGEPAFDVRYMFYSIRHWRPLVNGYSGGSPKSYETLTEAMKDTDTRPDRAWDAIVSSRATHVVVHEGFILAIRALA